MNHHHRKVLHGIFAHPLHHNLDPRQVESVLGELGAEMKHGGHGALLVKLNGQQGSFHLGTHSVPGEEVMRLRRFLTAAGIDPQRDYPI
ncbi:MAG: hypothetical protein RMK64_10175 [Rhodovarius sp.]|nr:hypothetical protein [Rhodovarius sp.]MCX7932245.1 hypothetical protein [Rhodovarius sp.]MDW8315325.1 hypothetical protein [Rhodovarius sp.]